VAAWVVLPVLLQHTWCCNSLLPDGRSVATHSHTHHTATPAMVDRRHNNKHWPIAVTASASRASMRAESPPGALDPHASHARLWSRLARRLTMPTHEHGFTYALFQKQIKNTSTMSHFQSYKDNPIQMSTRTKFCMLTIFFVFYCYKMIFHWRVFIHFFQFF